MCTSDVLDVFARPDLQGRALNGLSVCVCVHVFVLIVCVPVATFVTVCIPYLFCV